MSSCSEQATFIALHLSGLSCSCNYLVSGGRFSLLVLSEKLSASLSASWSGCGCLLCLGLCLLLTILSHFHMSESVEWLEMCEHHSIHFSFLMVSSCCCTSVLTVCKSSLYSVFGLRLYSFRTRFSLVLSILTSGQ